MKFTANVGDFREAFETASLTVDKVKTAGATKMMLLQAIKEGKKTQVRLFSTDMTAASLEKTAAVVEEPGSALVDPRELAKILPNLDSTETIEVSPAGTRLQVKCGRFRPKLIISDPGPLADRLKELPLKEKPTLEIPAWKLREVFERTLGFSPAKNDNAAQAFMSNIFLRTFENGVESYSANDGILAKARINGLDVPEEKMITVDIPAKSVPALQKILSNPQFKVKGDDAPLIRLILTEREERRYLAIRTDDIFYNVALSPYRIPKEAVNSEARASKAITASLQLNRDGLIASVRRCQPFLAEQKRLRFELKGNQIQFFDADGEELDVLSGTGEENGESTGTVNVSALSSVLASFKEEIIQLQFVRAKSCMLVSGGSDETGRGFYTVLCMREAPVVIPKAEVEAAAPAEETK